MTSHNCGDIAYVPFWVLLEFLDITPPDPFVKVTITSIGIRNYNSPNGPIAQNVCDLELKPGLTAIAVPAEFLIKESDLAQWAKNIADWFLSYKVNHEIATTK